MYPVPLGLHAASSLYQCFSLESLDRYSLCASVGVISCVAEAFFGLDSNGESLHLIAAAKERRGALW